MLRYQKLKKNFNINFILSNLIILIVIIEGKVVLFFFNGIVIYQCFDLFLNYYNVIIINFFYVEYLFECFVFNNFNIKCIFKIFKILFKNLEFFL